MPSCDAREGLSVEPWAVRGTLARKRLSLSRPEFHTSLILIYRMCIYSGEGFIGEQDLRISNCEKHIIA